MGETIKQCVEQVIGCSLPKAPAPRPSCKKANANDYSNAAGTFRAHKCKDNEVCFDTPKGKGHIQVKGDMLTGTVTDHWGLNWKGIDESECWKLESIKQCVEAIMGCSLPIAPP